MALEIRPGWDRSETVSVRVCEQRRELIVSAGSERIQFVLREERPGRIHWVERTPGRRGVRNVPVSVGDVVCHCLREWDAEQRVIELSLAVAARAQRAAGAGSGRVFSMAQVVSAASRRAPALVRVLNSCVSDSPRTTH